MVEIAKCPICGKVPHESSKTEGRFYIECCGIDTDPQRTYERAVISWNGLAALHDEISWIIQKEAKGE